MMNEESTFDLVVVGSGAAGLTAAVVAAHRSLSVLVIEKAETFGGTTARSGAVAWIPNNPHMASAGLSDSPEQADHYLRDLMGNFYDEGKVGAFLRHGPEMVGMMEANSVVRFDNWHSLDYEPWRKGAARGRSIGAAEFDGRRLGKDLARISPGLPNLSILGGMQVAYADVAHFGAAFRNRAAFLYTARKIGRYVRDLLLHGRPTRLVGGNALIGALLLTAREKGVTLWPSTPMMRLQFDQGAVRGVIVRRDGREQVVVSRRGVVLASGGYGGNDAMRHAYLPLAGAGCSLQPETNVGDGLHAGGQAGGHVVTDNVANGIWAALSTRVDRSGRRLHHPHIFRDRAFPGFLLVDRHGRRFVNEGASYQELGNVMIRKDIQSAWLICCHAALRTYGMGHVRPGPLPYKNHIRNGYLKTAATIPALAQRLGIDPAVLDATVDRFNGFARDGHDSDFNKGEDAYTAEQGDPQHQPNPTLGPVDPGPFYAVEIRPGEFSTINGLETDASARVLNATGETIAGLYAIGVDANSVFRGAYPGGGASIGPGMTFGYIAAMHAASN
ncbi:FAD-dependent oxidoreductase [Sphingobium sp. TKS]|uniref:FAD-dependent oxidoreductase n=1 Tax=Sphingobium sp. TKS TaxID=1315974 RepID=UPI0007704559|nr:FAD-dependent oxidoreductase [Sphingobium sp. TKS]AMK25302.1 FAD binding domain-containing protein 15 [Sphingobium sp. TKS]